MSTPYPDKVAWSEGVLLQPQHFQQLDRYHESLLAFRLDAIERNNWGALKVELDLRALQQGSIALLGFEGIMPDGTPVIIGSERGVPGPKQRPLQDLFPPSRRALTIYLGLPRERPRVNNYSLEGDGLRYAIRPRKVADISRDDRECDMSMALPNVSLFVEGEPLDGFTTLPIAQIVRDPQGALTLSPSFIPPTPYIQSAAPFTARLERLLRAMASRLRVLSDTRRITGEGRVEFNAADVTRYLQMSAINSMLPSMNYLARSSDASPRTAYLLLSQLAGQLATFSPEFDMTQPLEFDFGDLEATFRELFDLNERLLALSDSERFVTCLLQSHGGGRHYGDLRDVRIEHCVRFLISIESSLPPPQIVEEFVRRGKAASHGDMEFVLNKNVGGMGLRETLRPPVELPVKPGLVYFDLLNTDEVFWKHVRQDRNLVVWLPPALEQTQPAVRLLGIFGSR
jgi:type VI secretion system protein ImpJ